MVHIYTCASLCPFYTAGITVCVCIDIHARIPRRTNIQVCDYARARAHNVVYSVCADIRSASSSRLGRLLSSSSICSLLPVELVAAMDETAARTVNRFGHSITLRSSYNPKSIMGLKLGGVSVSNPRTRAENPRSANGVQRTASRAILLRERYIPLYSRQRSREYSSSRNIRHVQDSE